MKILHAVEYYHPSLGGAQEIVRRISEHLVQLGHEVTVATTKIPERQVSEYNGVTIQEFTVSGNKAKGLKGEVEKYRDFVKQGSFDIIMLYAAQQWTVDALLEILPEIKAKKVFVPCGFSGLNLPAYHEYFVRMPEWLNQFDWLVFLSNNYRDIDFAKQHGIQHFSVIPNGAAAEEFTSLPTDFRQKNNLEKTFLVLTVGSHTGVKGHTFAMRTFTKAKINDAALLVIGNTPLGGGCKRRCKILAAVLNQWPGNKKRQKQIIFMDPPRADVLGAYEAANLFIFPSNIEASPLVLFESMASGLPFITFDVGNAKEIITWSGGGMLAKTQHRANGYSYGFASDFAHQIEQLFSNQGLRQQLGQAGKSAWEQSFTIEKLAQKYEELYKQLVK